MAHFSIYTDESFETAKDSEMRLLFDKDTANGLNPDYWGDFIVKDLNKRVSVWSIKDAPTKTISFRNYDSVTGAYTDSHSEIEVRIPYLLPFGTTPTLGWDFHE